jgi:hypothetical protein
MTSDQLKADIDILATLLNTLAGLSPNAPRLQAYVTMVQNIAENPAVLAVLAAWINATVPPSLPVTRA